MVLAQAGENKIEVIMVLREVPIKEPSFEIIDLATAKRLVDATPCVVVLYVKAEAGERVKSKLESAGAMVKLKVARYCVRSLFGGIYVTSPDK